MHYIIFVLFCFVLILNICWGLLLLLIIELCISITDNGNIANDKISSKVFNIYFVDFYYLNQFYLL
jgi:hypothetical protein